MDWLLDRLLPAYDFRTRYTRRIAAPPGQVWAALHAVTYRDLPVTRLLMTVRTGPRRTGVSAAGPAMRTLPVPVLAEREASEIVAGAVAKFWRPRPVRGPASARTPAGFTAFTEPGWAKGAMSFQLSPLPGEGTLLATETRVLATDAATRRVFAVYWLIIRAGGAGLIRHEMLRAVAHHAERGAQRREPALPPA